MFFFICNSLIVDMTSMLSPQAFLLESDIVISQDTNYKFVSI